MEEKYHAAFIAPIGADKFLGKSGWEIYSQERLPEELILCLIQLLNLELSESCLGVEYYTGHHMKMSVFFDDNNTIEHIYCQAPSASLITLKDSYKHNKILSKAELFIPSELHAQ